MPTLGSSVPTVVMIGDESYGMPMAVTMYSLLKNVEGADAVNIYILTPFLSDDTKEGLRAITERSPVQVGLTFVDVEEESHFSHLDLHLREEWTRTIFYRLVLDKLLPKRHSRILYLDADTVVEGNIVQLWETDLEGRTLLAAQERTVSCPRFGVARWKELGFDPDLPYFNSGVMVVDMNRWRELNVGERILNYLSQHGSTLNIKGNQEGFNAILAGDWTPMSQRWNVLNWYFDDDLFDKYRYGDTPKKENLPSLRTDPYIIHYTHDKKPWDSSCNHPARDRFFQYLQEAEWLSPRQYTAWRVGLKIRGFAHSLKEVSRPLRHRIGLKRHPET